MKWGCGGGGRGEIVDYSTGVQIHRNTRPLFISGSLSMKNERMNERANEQTRKDYIKKHLNFHCSNVKK